MDNFKTILTASLIAGFIIYIAVKIIGHFKKESHIIKKLAALAENTLEMSPEEFMELRNKKDKRRKNAHISSDYGFSGIYIIYNHTKDMYYVGQSVNVLNRVNSHFTGKGNGDVYADYKYGDDFTVKMLSLESSGFESLDDLERYTIKVYDAYGSGYNKNRGIQNSTDQ